MLRAFLWMLTFFIADAIGGKLMGMPDGSVTYFFFRGVTFLTSAGVIGCILWFLCAFGLWAVRHM